ncbi:serine/threonine-protein kinase [Streptomyces sp. NRRL WC-3549]|uniref:serine/threonine-protein kinase n=1 Tax=Streptomyces sp. NRRL WC-3549 TaxID=1463925 RepID=UPI0004C6E1C8|nr:serine/threonine-protein kinase [Streptomyces sp. NRRL WC-3549]
MEKLSSGDPQRIGRYRLLGRLGAGGMGQVFLARSDRGRTVALKLVRPELAEQQQFRDRFRAEVRAAHRVGGAWTAPVLDADTEAAVPWVATGYVAGPSLHRIVSGRPGAPAAASEAYGPLPERSVRILGSGLARALRDIHRAGIVHRDLKPSNVLVTIDGPRVIDFGIARALDTATAGGLTRTGALIGSPGFMSPEQVRGERVTAACDVFCLGSVLTYAATGRMPFGMADSAAHALMFRIAQEDPDLTGIPGDLAGLIRDCLAKEPSERPATDTVLERLGETETAEPWLPGALIAQLGRHAVGLLDAEDPREPDDPDGPDGLRTRQETREEPPEAPGAHTGPSAPRAPQATAPGPVPPAGPPAAFPPVGPPAAPQGAGAPPPGPVGPPPGQPPGAVHPPPAPAGPAAPPPPYGFPSPPVPAYAHTPPYRPSAPPRPVPERRRTVPAVALAVVAVLVAVGAGWTVYSFMDGGDHRTTASPPPSPTNSPSGGASPGPSTGPSADASTDGQNGDGSLPAGYPGTWSGSVEGGAGQSTRRLVIQQGGVGDTVLSLTAEGPLDTGGSYHCVFRAELQSEPGSGSPVRIGPSRVVTAEPASSCTPGKPTVLTLLPDGSLRREIPETGESLTYTRAD